MRDGIEIARRGAAAVSIVTEKFRPQGEFVALAAGMPTVPQVVVPHPVAGRDEETMRAFATEAAARIVTALTAS